MKIILVENGYPSIFINKNMKSKQSKAQINLVEKKTLYMNIYFRGDRVIDITEAIAGKRGIMRPTEIGTTSSYTMVLMSHNFLSSS